jgi:hypothetical protein
MLDTDSNRVLSSDKNTLQSANDSLYSMLGIWTQVNALADRYVLLGELRGELMAIVPERADADMHAIANFDYSLTPKNKYITQREYYAIINNCNYFLQYADTVRYTGFESTLKREWVAIKAYRAWVYMQLALNHGEAVYLEKPLLTVEDVNAAEKQSSPISWEELFLKLIADLEPYRTWEKENSYPIYGVDASRSFAYFYIHHLLGDLYLWTRQYEAAAQTYHALMVHTKSIPVLAYKYTNQGFENGYSLSWDGVAAPWTGYYSNAFSEPNIALIPFLLNTNLATWTAYSYADTATYKLAPSQAAMDTWLESTVQLYRDKDSKVIYYYNGDSRGEQKLQGSRSMGSYISYSAGEGETAIPFIVKYGMELRPANGNSWTVINDDKAINLLRTSTLYLRYAEALNNLGKPATAFTILKYGVDDLTNPARNNVEEITPLPAYCDFNWMSIKLPPEDWKYIVGIHSYGSGDLEYDTLHYLLPDSTVLQAQADPDEYLRRFVEEKILDEYALETAFDGNRFHDLMRFALRNNDNTMLANRVARRNPALQSLLMDSKNWYLPKHP